jgi:RNA-binding protein
MIIELTPARRRALRASAHRLKPAVIVGDDGLSPGVLAEIDRTLEAHELIKVKIASGERENRETVLARICEALSAAPVQHIGRILVIFRERAAPEPEPPRPSTAESRRRKPVVRRALKRPPSRGR